MSVLDNEVKAKIVETNSIEANITIVNNLLFSMKLSSSFLK